MEYSIFYSWQSDSPANCNRSFIRSALDAAVADLGRDLQVEESPRIDSGMEGVAGTPEVATVMFEKIRTSAVFVGDVTLVGSIPRASEGDAKQTPNPNVLLEMGYAAGVLGWGRIICVMNEHFGARENQPFDVRNRRYPINYSLNPDGTSNATVQRGSLVRWLRYAIEAVHANEFSAARNVIASLDVNCLNVLYALGTRDSFPAPDPRATTFGGPLDTGKFTAAVVRLLDLRALKADVDPRQKLYAYHWTYLGKHVLIELGIRARPTAPEAPTGEWKSGQV